MNLLHAPRRIGPLRSVARCVVVVVVVMVVVVMVLKMAR